MGSFSITTNSWSMSSKLFNPEWATLYNPQTRIYVYADIDRDVDDIDIKKEEWGGIYGWSARWNNNKRIRWMDVRSKDNRDDGENDLLTCTSKDNATQHTE